MDGNREKDSSELIVHALFPNHTVNAEQRHRILLFKRSYGEYLKNPHLRIAEILTNYLIWLSDLCDENIISALQNDDYIAQCNDDASLGRNIVFLNNLLDVIIRTVDSLDRKFPRETYRYMSDVIVFDTKCVNEVLMRCNRSFARLQKIIANYDTEQSMYNTYKVIDKYNKAGTSRSLFGRALFTQADQIVSFVEWSIARNRQSHLGVTKIRRSRSNSSDVMKIRYSILIFHHHGLFGDRSIWEIQKEYLGHGNHGDIKQVIDVCTGKKRALKITQINGPQDVEEVHYFTFLAEQEQDQGPPIIIGFRESSDESNWKKIRDPEGYKDGRRPQERLGKWKSYMLMEQGESLEDLLIRRPYPDLLTILKFLLDIIAHLRYMHSKNFVYSDLCARNVLIVNRDGTSVAKVIDFDLSQRIGVTVAGLMTDPAMQDFTEKDTRHYLPPEIFDIRNSGRYYIARISIDSYSFGYLLYRINRVISLPFAIMSLAERAVFSAPMNNYSSSYNPCAQPYNAVREASQPEMRPQLDEFEGAICEQMASLRTSLMSPTPPISSHVSPTTPSNAIFPML